MMVVLFCISRNVCTDYSPKEGTPTTVRLWVLLDKLAVPQEIIPERHVLMQRANTLPELNIPLSYA